MLRYDTPSWSMISTLHRSLTDTKTTWHSSGGEEEEQILVCLRLGRFLINYLEPTFRSLAILKEFQLFIRGSPSQIPPTVTPSPFERLMISSW